MKSGAILLILMLASAVGGDVVHLHDGGSVEGQVQRVGDIVRVKFSTGSVEFNEADVKRIEVLALPQKIFAQQLAQVGDDADACVNLHSSDGRADRV